MERGKKRALLQKPRGAGGGAEGVTMHIVRTVRSLLTDVPLSSLSDSTEKKLRKSSTAETKLYRFGVQKRKHPDCPISPIPTRRR